MGNGSLGPYTLGVGRWSSDDEGSAIGSLGDMRGCACASKGDIEVVASSRSLAREKAGRIVLTLERLGDR